MNQTEFNKEERFNNLIKQAKEKQLGYQFVLEEVKRNHWNVNAKQVELISTTLDFNNALVLFHALDLNILNVDNQTKKALNKQRKNREDYV